MLLLVVAIPVRHTHVAPHARSDAYKSAATNGGPRAWSAGSELRPHRQIRPPSGETRAGGEDAHETWAAGDSNAGTSTRVGI